MMVLMFQREWPSGIGRARERPRPTDGWACSRTGVLKQKSCSTFLRPPSCRSPKVHLVAGTPGAPQRRRKPATRPGAQQVAAAAFGQAAEMLRQSSNHWPSIRRGWPLPRMSIRRGAPRLFGQWLLFAMPVNCPIYESKN